MVERGRIGVEFLVSKLLTGAERADIFQKLQEKFHHLKKFRYLRVGEMGFYVEGEYLGEKRSAEKLSREIIGTVKREVQGLVREYDSIKERKKVSEELKRRGIRRMERCPSCGSTQLRPLGSASGWPIYQLHAGQYFVCGVCGYHGPLVVTGDIGEEIKKRGFDKGRYYPKVSSPLFKRIALYFFVVLYLLLPIASLLLFKTYL